MILLGSMNLKYFGTELAGRPVCSQSFFPLQL